MMIEDYHNEAAAKDLMRKVNVSYFNGLVSGVCLTVIVGIILWMFIN